jgi:hypothetical protein
MDLAAIQFVQKDAPALAAPSGPDLLDADLPSKVSVVHRRVTCRSQELLYVFLAFDELHLDEPTRNSRDVGRNQSPRLGLAEARALFTCTDRALKGHLGAGCHPR